MTDEVDLAMQLSVSQNQVRKLEKRLFGLMYESFAFTQGTAELIKGMLTRDADRCNKQIECLAEWGVDVEINMLTNLLTPVTDTRFTDKDLRTLVPKDILTDILDLFQELGAKHAKQISLEWDEFAQEHKQGTRSQRVAQVQGDLSEIMKEQKALIKKEKMQGLH